MNLQHASTTIVRTSLKQKDPGNSVNPRIVLTEIFELLEEYGPVWFTEELHDRAKAALATYQ